MTPVAQRRTCRRRQGRRLARRDRPETQVDAIIPVRPSCRGASQHVAAGRTSTRSCRGRRAHPRSVEFGCVVVATPLGCGIASAIGSLDPCRVMTLPHLSLRAQLGLALIVVNMLLTAGVALFAYQAAHDAMVDQAIGSVSVVAQSRERELMDVLEHRQERLAGFLQSLESLCGEVGPSGGFGWQDECVRTAVGGFHRSERAVSTTVTYRGRRLTRIGAAPTVSAPRPDRLARISASPGTGATQWPPTSATSPSRRSSLSRTSTRSSPTAPASNRTGRAFLTDAAGYRLTSGQHARGPAIPRGHGGSRPVPAGDRAGDADERLPGHGSHRRTAPGFRHRRRLHRRQRELRRRDGTDSAARTSADVRVRTRGPARRRGLRAARERGDAFAQAPGAERRAPWPQGASTSRSDRGTIRSPPTGTDAADDDRFDQHADRS